MKVVEFGYGTIEVVLAMGPFPGVGFDYPGTFANLRVTPGGPRPGVRASRAPPR